MPARSISRGKKGCTLGKSCGATCINRSKYCEIEFGPKISQALGNARQKLGVMNLYRGGKELGVKGYDKQFNLIKGQIEKERAGGRALRKQEDLQEFKKRLQDAGLHPKTKKSDDLGAIFNRGIEAGKAKSVPPDLKAQLAALGGVKETTAVKPAGQKATDAMERYRRRVAAAEEAAKRGEKPAVVEGRKAEKSPGDKVKTAPQKKKSENTDMILDDISRIMRGESPKNLQVASAGTEGGIRARIKPTEIRKVERQLQSALGSKANSSMNVDQLREAAAKQANSLSLKYDKATGGAERKALRDQMNKLEAAIKRADELNATATGNTRWARVDAKDFDGALGKVRREGETGFNGWSGSYGSGASKIGEGAYGTVMRNADGTYIKRGAISDTEANLIKRLGDKDLGPKLIAADINGAHPYNRENFVDIKNGRIAMGQVPGQPIGTIAQPQTQIGGKNAADVYWKAMADLHRLGIAHNDAHIDNILVDNKGKGRWVDLGLAQASPKAALAEAMGIFPTLKGGDAVSVPGSARGDGNWQTKRWDAAGTRTAEQYQREGRWAQFQQRFPVASKVWDNQPAAIRKLESLGLDTNEINSIIAHGIRSPMKSYDESDGFGRITDKQAQEVLNILYDGI